MKWSNSIYFKPTFCAIDRVAIIKSGKIVKMGKMKDIKGDESLEEVFLELGDK